MFRGFRGLGVVDFRLYDLRLLGILGARIRILRLRASGFLGASAHA